MPKWLITVTKSFSEQADVEVEATTYEEAKKKAIDDATTNDAIYFGDAEFEYYASSFDNDEQDAKIED